MVTGDDLVRCAKLIQNAAYLWGAKPSPGLAPEQVKTCDCSGLVTYCLEHLGLHIAGFQGAKNQYAHCQPFPLEHARTTPGALVFWRRPVVGIVHVGVSTGNGYTVEARGRDAGVGVFKWDDKRPWNVAGLIPGVKY